VMGLITIVEDYVSAAMKRAGVEELEDGTLVAWVPGLEGIIVTGADRHECAEGLFDRLEDWVKVGLTRGIELPVIDGIDLNTERARALASYHPASLRSTESGSAGFFEDGEHFMDHLSSRSQD
jgi:hypothetical protein